MGLTTVRGGSLRAVFLILLLLREGSSLDIDVTDGGYSNVVVALGDDLEAESCATYVANIKALINSASPVLYSATGKRLYFSSVIIMIPDSWTSCGAVEIDPNLKELTFEDSHIRVHTPHPFFENNPWTQQPRGCGDPGEYIYLSSGFLSEASPKWGSQGTVFVHEWAKFRWGVFEEYGHVGDSIFPSAYRFNATAWEPNYCTNDAVSGSFHSCDSDTPEAECTFTPSIEQGKNITSSLLAAPFISTIRKFCSNEDHVTSAPTKQNFLCHKKSTWDIISEHPDISETAPSQFQEDISYNVQYMKKSLPINKIVFLLDTTESMGSKTILNRWEYLRDAVRQFIITKAADGLQVAVIPFSNSVTVDRELVTLNATNRKTLADSVPDDVSTSTLKNVTLAVNIAANVLGESGKIILITGNLESQAEDKFALVNSARGLAVQPILYPSSKSTSFYIPVAEMNSLYPQVVNNVLVDEKSQSVECLTNLTQLIEKACQSSFTEVISGSSSGSSAPIILNVEDASIYESEFFIEVLKQKGLASNAFEVLDTAGNEMKASLELDSSVIYQGKTLTEGKYTVTLTLSVELAFHSSVYAVAKVSSPQSNYAVDVSASSPLSDLRFTDNPPSAPIIYAKLSDGIHPIVYAEVTAKIRIQRLQEIYSFDLKLWDSGIEGDVTGNDGTYSSYLIGVEEKGILTISVTASDNNGTAMIVKAASPTSLSAAPVDPGDLSRACCGSSLKIPDSLLTNAGTFTVSSSPGIHGNATGQIPGANMYLPGRVTDLKSIRVDDELNLTFTATGEDANLGKASSYNVKDILNPALNLSVNISVNVGTVISTLVSVNCDTAYSFVVEAIDSKGQRSEPSNEVHVIYSCVGPGELSAGAIVGIVFGCLFFILILLFVFCAIFKRDKLKKSKLGFIYKCSCCKCKKKVDNSEDIRRSHLVTSRIKNDISARNPAPHIDGSGHIRSPNEPTTIRSIGDVLRRGDPIWAGRSISDTESPSYSRQNNMREKGLRDDSSSASSVPSSDNPMFNPHNQVGIPPQRQNQFHRGYGQHDNYAYNDSESGVYTVSHPAGVNKKPILPPIQRKNMTQV